MQLKPAADRVAQNAEPLAERAIAEGVKPATEAVAQNAEPLAKELTEGQIKPAAKQVRTVPCSPLPKGKCGWSCTQPAC